MKIELVYNKNTIIISIDYCDGIYSDDTLEGDRIIGYYVTNKNIV